jgi:hypothetical protein
MQLQSILATRERAAGALIDRPRSAGYFEIRRMSGLVIEWPLLAQSGRTGNAVLDAACLHHASARRVFVAILGLGAAAA